MFKLPNVLCILPVCVAVARSFSGGVVMPYILPVVCMTSRLPIIGPDGVTLPQQHRCNVVHVLTPVMRDI